MIIININYYPIFHTNQWNHTHWWFPSTGTRLVYIMPRAVCVFTDGTCARFWRLVCAALHFVYVIFNLFGIVYLFKWNIVYKFDKHWKVMIFTLPILIFNSAQTTEFLTKYHVFSSFGQVLASTNWTPVLVLGICIVLQLLEYYTYAKYNFVHIFCIMDQWLFITSCLQRHSATAQTIPPLSQYLCLVSPRNDCSSSECGWDRMWLRRTYSSCSPGSPTDVSLVAKNYWNVFHKHGGHWRNRLWLKIRFCLFEFRDVAKVGNFD